MKFNTKIGEKKIEIEINDWAEQANGSALVRIGNTLVMAVATMSPRDSDDLDFFPLTVEYQEKFYAAGKILGSRFLRREARPSQKAILTSRIIDRTIRPLFPENLKRAVQVIVTCLSFDEENEPDVAGILAASIALSVSDIPWQGPVGSIRIQNPENSEDFILNPTCEQRAKDGLDLLLCGVQKGKEVVINMIEAGANEAQEEQVLKAIPLANQELEKLIKLQNEITKQLGKEKLIIKEISFPEVDKKIETDFREKLENALFQPSNIENKRALESLVQEIVDVVEKEFGEDKVSYAKNQIEALLDKILQINVLEKDRRPDKRKLNELRPITSSCALLPQTHGSALFIRGKTKALSAVTLGPPGDEQLVDGMEIHGKKRYMHHYNFPPYCSGEVKGLRGPGRREIGHGALAEKAILPLLPNFQEFPYTIRVVTEILSSNGSTSMASVSASSLSLMDAGVPIKRPAAGIAIGIIESGKNYKLLKDIQGPEDHYGGMDFKVAGTVKGITAIQMDVKIKGINQSIIKEALALAKEAREEILEKTAKTLDQPREKLSPLAPKILSLQINPDKIGSVIGSGGKTINAIADQYGVKIDIEEDGNIFVSSESKDSAEQAKEWIRNLTREPVVGEVFQGTVKKILDFGAFVEFLPGKEGLVHISQLSNSRVNKVEDVLKVGDVIPVKLISIDEQGRMNLSLKQAKN